MLGRRGRARRTAAGRSGAAARVAVLFGLVLVMVGLLAPGAGANYARVSARVGCDRMVQWQASASTEGTDDDRTNPRVRVEYRPRGADPWTAAGPEGSFSAANDFRFSGSFPMPDGVDAVELRVTPLGRWGAAADGENADGENADGGDDEAGEPRFATARVPEACAEQPLAASQDLDCRNGTVQVVARNVGDRPITAEVVVDRVLARALPLPPRSEETLTVPVLAGRATPIEVRAGDVVASSLTPGADCPVDGPAAVVVERCGAPLGRLVVLANGGGRPVSVEVRVRGAVVDRARIDPDTVLQRTLEVPDEDLPSQGLPVEVLLDGQVAAAGPAGGCDGPVAGLLSCGTAGRPACDLSATRPTTPPEPPVPPPPLTIERGGPTLPRTGPQQRAIGLLLGGTLLLGGGMSLAARDRRQRPPSLLAEAIAPYRQRWWDDP